MSLSRPILIGGKQTMQTQTDRPQASKKSEPTFLRQKQLPKKIYLASGTGYSKAILSAPPIH